MLADQVVNEVLKLAEEYGAVRAKIAVQRLYNRDVITEYDAKDLIVVLRSKTGIMVELK